MKWLFWISLVMIAYPYLGYPLWVYLRARFRGRPIRPARVFPSASIVLAVHNEERALPAKLRNLAALHYPKGLLEIVVVSDGSTDGTNRILEASKQEYLRVIVSPEHEGKACALNRGIQAAQGEIVVFTDARQAIAPEALSRLVADFADPMVGCVSGELVMAGQPDNGVGSYWNLEKKIRKWESVGGSVIGATGAFYAVRKQLLVPLPPDTILDDVFIPLHVARLGSRVIFEPQARVWDPLRAGLKHEFHRRVRTLVGNYQLLRLAPWVLSRVNPVRFEFVSHKLLRLLVPFALVIFFGSSALIRGTFYELCTGLQVVFYSLGALGLFHPKLGLVGRLANLVLTFLMLNCAAVVAFLNFLTGKKQVWIRPA